MARLTRKNIKVFAENATNNGVFGSLQAGNPVTTTNVEQVQSLPAWSTGWNSATMTSEKLPPLEEFQGVQYVTTYQQAYLMQEGIPEWASTVTYYKGCLAKEVTANGFRIYNSLTDNNTNHSLSDTSNWKKIMDSDDLYAFDNSVVHLTGDETINGAKTFTSNVTQASTSPRLNLKDTDIERGSVPSAKNVMAIDFQDTNGNYLGYVQSVYNTNKAVYTQIGARKSINSSDTEVANIVVGYYSTGIAYSECPTPTDTTSTSSKQIVTVGFLNGTSHNLVHKSGNETIAGTKTFSSTISGSINGNAATVTNGVYTTGNQTIGGTKTFSAVAYGKASDANNSILTTVAKTKAAKGGFKLGNGMIVNWGIFSGSGGTATFPIPFSGTDYGISMTRISANGTNDNDAITAVTSTNFTATIYQGGGAHWVAIGY